jgi:hypothetical protein
MVNEKRGKCSDPETTSQLDFRAGIDLAKLHHSDGFGSGSNKFWVGFVAGWAIGTVEHNNGDGHIVPLLDVGGVVVTIEGQDMRTKVHGKSERNEAKQHNVSMA